MCDYVVIAITENLSCVIGVEYHQALNKEIKYSNSSLIMSLYNAYIDKYTPTIRQGHSNIIYLLYRFILILLKLF